MKPPLLGPGQGLAKRCADLNTYVCFSQVAGLGALGSQGCLKYPLSAGGLDRPPPHPAALTTTQRGGEIQPGAQPGPPWRPLDTSLSPQAQGGSLLLLGGAH